MSPSPLRSILFAVFLLFFTGLTALENASRNIAPDALSRATTWNTHAGDPALLQDGRVPPADPAAEAFVWQTKGILVFEWDEALPLESVRIYVGDVGNNYQVRTYLGGRLDPTGTLREPEGEQTALIEVNDRVVDQWLEIPLPPGTLADNLELWTLGSTVFYEVEIHARSDHATALSPLSWARIKSLP